MNTEREKSPVDVPRGEPTIPSFILQQACVVLFFIVNIFAIYLLMRGHNAPGGGFIAGLCTGISLIMLHLAFGVRRMHQIVRFDPARIAVVGLLISLTTPVLSVLAGKHFFQHTHFHFENLPLIGEFHTGTPLIFDIGVYLVVIGVSCKLIFTIAQSTQGFPSFLREEENRYSSPLEVPIDLSADREEKN